MKKNSDITILLTIFNRPDYTNKWLNYAEQSNVPFKIFISDGGNIKSIKTKLNLKKRKLDIKHKKFKYYKNYNYMFEKFYLSVKKIKTKYIFIAEDDDYIFSNSILKSAKFLNKNRKFSCVKGINCLGDLIRNNGKVLSLTLRNEGKEKKKSLLSNFSDLRLIQYYEEKHLSFYNGLHRKESLLKTFKILNSRNFLNLFITELIFCLSVIYNGKVARLNHIDYIKMDHETAVAVDHKFWFKVENLKIMPGTYEVSVSKNKISNFKNTNVDIEYFIALEPESYYGK